MRPLIAWLVDHATTVLIATLCIFVFGLAAYVTLPREASPDITIPVVIVTTPYIGVSPEDIEGLITEPVENELASLKGIKQLNSTSAEGISIVSIEFEPDIVIEDALQRVRDRVSRARAGLPDDVEESSVREISFSDIPVLLVTIAGPVDEEILKGLAESLQDDITRIPGVLDAKLAGGKEQQLRVQILPDRLAHYGLALHDVTGALADENVNIPGGNVEVGRGNFLLRVPGEFTTPEEIGGVAIKRVGDRPVFIRDVARVVDGYKDRESYSRMQGNPAVTLSVTKRAGANILAVASETKALSAKHAESWPEGVEFRALADASKEIDQSVSDLQNNIITALILVVSVIIFFMGLRNSLFVALSIPLSMLAAMLVLQALGFTLNMIVLFSLILALGMLVDNGIVVVENIYRHKGMGKSRRDAAVDGTSEVAIAVAASTATTVAAFLPLVFWTGIMGEFMGFLPKTVIIVLIMSLVMAVAVLPVAMSRLMPSSLGSGKSGEEAEMRNSDLNFVMATYKKVLELSISLRYLSALGGAGALLFTFVAFAFLNHGLEFFPETEPARAIVGVKLPQGTDLETTDRIIREVEQIISEQENVETFVAESGVNSSGDALQGTSSMPNEGRITVDFLPDANTAKPGQKSRIEPSSVTVTRLRDLTSVIPGAKISLRPAEMGPPVGKAITVEVRGDNFDEVGLVVQQLRRQMEKIPGATDLEDDYVVGRPELQLRVDRGAAKRVGVSTRAVGGAVRTAIAGQVATTVRSGGDDIDVLVELAPEERADLQQVLALRIPGREDTSPKTFPVPLSAVATYELVGGAGSIRHIDQDLVVSITGDVLAGYNENDVRAEVDRIVNEFDLPEGMSFSLTGANQEQEESMAFLIRAFMLAIAGIVIVLVSQFDRSTGPEQDLPLPIEVLSVLAMPAIIMATVLLSLIGVLWGLVITGTPFGVIMTGIGVISLAGVVVNNAIVLLDYVQQLLAKGLNVKDALVEAGLTRFRPVMLTAITTTLGLVPMALGVSFDFFSLKLILGSNSAQWWGPMAVAVIFGLTVATVLTLVMVPTLFSIYDDFRRLSLRIFGGTPKKSTPAAAAATTAVLALFAMPFDAEAITLDEAFAAAEQNNLQLAMAREQSRSASSTRGLAWSALSPRLSTSATYVVNNQEIAFDMTEAIPEEFAGFLGDAADAEPTVIQEKEFLMADVVATQRFFSGTALPGLKGAYKLHHAGVADVERARQQMRAQVASAYYQLLMAREGIGVAEQSLGISEHQLELARRQADAGLTAPRAAIQAQLSLARAKRDLDAAKEQAVGAEEAFSIATGLSDVELVLPPPFEVPEDLEAAVQRANAQRPDLQAGRLRSEAARLERNARDWAWLPVVDGRFAYNYSENTGFNDQNWTWQASLVAKWDLWDGGTKLSQKADLAARYRMSQLQVELAERTAAQEIRTAWEALRRAESGLSSVDTELELAEENLRMAKGTFEAGSATWLEVEQAELMLRSTKLTRIQSQMARDLAALQVLVATGELP